MQNYHYVGDTVATWTRIRALSNEQLRDLEAAQRLLWSGRLLDEILNTASNATGLSKRGDYEVLALLHRSDPTLLSPIDVATRLRLSASGVTGKLDRLQREDLLERLQDPRDRRALRLRITDRGRSLVEANFDEGLRIFRSLFNAVPSRDLEVLVGLLRVVHEQLSAVSVIDTKPLSSQP